MQPQYSHAHFLNRARFNIHVGRRREIGRRFMDGRLQGYLATHFTQNHLRVRVAEQFAQP